MPYAILPNCILNLKKDLSLCILLTVNYKYKTRSYIA